MSGFLTTGRLPATLAGTTQGGIPLSEMSFLLALFAVIEHINKSELTTSGKKLIIAYLNNAGGTTYSEKARATVHRYAMTVLPSLESIQTKSRTMRLDALDRLVVKLEREASTLRGR